MRFMLRPLRPKNARRALIYLVAIRAPPLLNRGLRAHTSQPRTLRQKNARRALIHFVAGYTGACAGVPGFGVHRHGVRSTPIPDDTPAIGIRVLSDTYVDGICPGSPTQAPASPAIR